MFMKRILSLCLVLAALLSCVPALAADDTNGTFDANVDYMKCMLEAASLGTSEALERGARYEALRNQKIVAMDARYETTSFFSSYDSALEIENAIRAYQGLELRTQDEAEQPDAGAAEEQLYTVNASSLNCRVSPSTAAAIVARFPRGTVLTGLGQEENGFIKVQGGSVTGWCSAEFLEKKTVANNVPAGSYTQEDLEWLALAIYREAGCEWFSDTHQLLVGNVVLNRVASEEFPNTIKGVLTQRGQYPWAKNPYSNGTPLQRCYDNAKRLLNGERFCPENVVFQAEFRQGSGVYQAIYDKVLNTTTYFCYR